MLAVSICCCIVVLAGVLGRQEDDVTTIVTRQKDARGWYTGWNTNGRIPMLANQVEHDSNSGTTEEEARGKNFLKKYKRYMLPLLLAYKLKFFTLIPILIGGLVLLTGATGLAGFFFALFAATMGLKSGGDQ